MRYYFHLYNDIEALDEEGTELPDPQAACELAKEYAREMAAESVKAGHLDLSHRVEVTDEGGAPVFKVMFGEVVAIREQAAG
jgi:hypothetical protein